MGVPKASFGPTSGLLYEYGSAVTTAGQGTVASWDDVAGFGTGVEGDAWGWVRAPVQDTRPAQHSAAVAYPRTVRDRGPMRHRTLRPLGAACRSFHLAPASTPTRLRRPALESTLGRASPPMATAWTAELGRQLGGTSTPEPKCPNAEPGKAHGDDQQSAQAAGTSAGGDDATNEKNHADDEDAAHAATHPTTKTCAHN